MTFQTERAPFDMEAVEIHNGFYASTIEYILCTAKTKKNI